MKNLEEFLNGWRELLGDARRGLLAPGPNSGLIDRGAIELLAGTVTAGAYVLEELASSRVTQNVVKEIAAQRRIWPILFGGVLPSNQKIFKNLGLGTKLPYRLDQFSRHENKKLTEFVLDVLLFKVIQVANLYQYFQTPECPPELKVSLPDYAAAAARLGERMTRDSFEDWWRCLEAEFEDWRAEQMAYFRETEVEFLGVILREAEPGLTDQELNRRITRELTGYETQRDQFPSYLKHLVRQKLWSLAYP